MSQKKIHLPSTADEATRALSFEEPLGPGDPRYLDLSPGRGEDTRARVRKLLESKPLGQQRYVWFASHRGAGKTTELNRLQEEIRHRYFTIYLEANVEMDAISIEMDDLLLVMAARVEVALREAGVALDPKLVDEVAQWFATVVESTEAGRAYKMEIEGEVKAGLTTPIFASWMSRITSLYRVETAYRTQVKNELRKYPGTLLQRMNQLLRTAHEELKRQRNQELLIIIDNLDRYDPEVIDRLLLKSADQITTLACNLIFTPPIALVYQPDSGTAEDLYSVEVMPSVKLREQADAYDQLSGKGVELLLGLLGRRIDLDVLIPSHEDRMKLVRASGGSARELMRVVLDAFLYTDGPLSSRVVDKAVNRHRGAMRTKINLNGWADVLARIARTKQAVNDPDCLKVLFFRLAFQYNETIWFDIHPLLAEVPEIQDASARLK